MPELKKVKEHLYDFYEITDGNTIRDLLGNIWECETDTKEKATQLINMRIDTLTLWLQGFKRK
jgi:hypothetical protein